eukprot:7905802-Alexandrium_andersonii.AAC.1
MSASLVGSEMCIRDRGGLGGWFGASLTSFARYTIPLGGAPAWGCRYTVSYTHLTLPTICSV